MTNLCALLDYGLLTNVFIRALDASTKDIPIPKIVIGDEPASTEQEASATEKPSNTEDAPVTITTEAIDDVVDLSKRFKTFSRLWKWPSKRARVGLKDRRCRISRLAFFS